MVLNKEKNIADTIESHLFDKGSPKQKIIKKNRTKNHTVDIFLIISLGLLISTLIIYFVIKYLVNL